MGVCAAGSGCSGLGTGGTRCPWRRSTPSRCPSGRRGRHRADAEGSLPCWGYRPTPYDVVLIGGLWTAQALARAAATGARVAVETGRAPAWMQMVHAMGGGQNGMSVHDVGRVPPQGSGRQPGAGGARLRDAAAARACGLRPLAVGADAVAVSQPGGPPVAAAGAARRRAAGLTGRSRRNRAGVGAAPRRCGRLPHARRRGHALVRRPRPAVRDDSAHGRRDRIVRYAAQDGLTERPRAPPPQHRSGICLQNHFPRVAPGSFTTIVRFANSLDACGFRFWARCDGADPCGGADGPAVVALVVIRLGPGATRIPRPTRRRTRPHFARKDAKTDAKRAVASARHLRVLDHTRRNCEQRSGRDPRAGPHPAMTSPTCSLRPGDGRVHHRLRATRLVHAERVGPSAQASPTPPPPAPPAPSTPPVSFDPAAPVAPAAHVPPVAPVPPAVPASGPQPAWTPPTVPADEAGLGNGDIESGATMRFSAAALKSEFAERQAAALRRKRPRARPGAAVAEGAPVGHGPDGEDTTGGDFELSAPAVPAGEQQSAEASGEVAANGEAPSSAEGADAGTNEHDGAGAAAADDGSDNSPVGDGSDATYSAAGHGQGPRTSGPTSRTRPGEDGPHGEVEASQVPARSTRATTTPRTPQPQPQPPPLVANKEPAGASDGDVEGAEGATAAEGEPPVAAATAKTAAQDSAPEAPVSQDAAAHEADDFDDWPQDIAPDTSPDAGTDVPQDARTAAPAWAPPPLPQSGLPPLPPAYQPAARAPAAQWPSPSRSCQRSPGPLSSRNRRPRRAMHPSHRSPRPRRDSRPSRRSRPPRRDSRPCRRRGRAGPRLPPSAAAAAALPGAAARPADGPADRPAATAGCPAAAAVPAAGSAARARRLASAGHAARAGPRGPSGRRRSRTRAARVARRLRLPAPRDSGSRRAQPPGPADRLRVPAAQRPRSPVHPHRRPARPSPPHRRPPARSRATVSPSPRLRTRPRRAATASRSSPTRDRSQKRSRRSPSRRWTPVPEPPGHSPSGTTSVSPPTLPPPRSGTRPRWSCPPTGCSTTRSRRPRAVAPPAAPRGSSSAVRRKRPSGSGSWS